MSQRVIKSIFGRFQSPLAPYILFTLLATPIIAASGCSGFGPNPSPSPTPTPIVVSPRVDIAWAELSRSLNAPTSARSVVVTIAGAGADGSGVSNTFSRDPEKPFAHTQLVTLTDCRVGTYSITATFYADINGRGALVGVATRNVELGQYSSNLPEFTTAGEVDRVVIGDSTINVGQEVVLPVEVLNKAGQAIAVAPSSIFVTVVTGSAVDAINGTTIKGDQPGISRLRVSCDSASTEINVTVLVPPTPTPTPSPTPVPTPTPVPELETATIVYSNNLNGGFDLYKLNPVTFAVTNVTNTIGLDERKASIAFDRNRVAFQRVTPGGSSSVAVLNLKTLSVATVSSGLSQASSPSWSPVEDKIAFVGRVNATTQLFTAKPDGTRVSQLTFEPNADDSDPAYAPDGTQITFARSLPGITSGRDIYVLDATGGNEQRLIDTPGDDYLPVWSPDGSKIAFVTTRTGDAEIFVYTFADNSTARITNNPAEDTEPTWSGDGKRIIFVSKRGGSYRLYGCDADKLESGVSRLTNPANGEDREPTVAGVVTRKR